MIFYLINNPCRHSVEVEDHLEGYSTGQSVTLNFFNLFLAEFGDYDSPDLSANYLEEFKVCPDQVCRLWRHYLFTKIFSIKLILFSYFDLFISASRTCSKNQ